MRFVRVFAISIAILLFFLANAAPGYASKTPHGCAQPVPPLMSGSPSAPPATPGIVLINEVLNNPASTWNCSEPTGTSSLTTDSWVELYNPQNQAFNLYEARASLDSGSLDNAFHFPFGSAIAAHGYLVVFPETYILNNTLLNGNTLRLMFGGVTVIDEVSVPALAPTLVTGKQPDWTKLQLPATNSAVTATTNSPLVASPATSTNSGAWDTQRRILLTVLVVALALSLFWCWKLFSSP